MRDCINALIPGTIGLVVPSAPALLTKARGSAGEDANSRIRGVGSLLPFAAKFQGFAEFSCH